MSWVSTCQYISSENKEKVQKERYSLIKGQKANEHRDVLWRRYMQLNSKTAFEKYKGARNDYSKIRKEQRVFEKKNVHRARENPELPYIYQLENNLSCKGKGF